MFVTRKFIPRRTFLSGMGVMVGLPLLEAKVRKAVRATISTVSPASLSFPFASISIPPRRR